MGSLATGVFWMTHMSEILHCHCLSGSLFSVFDEKMGGACDSHQADHGPAGRRCRRSWTHFSVWICLNVKYFDKPWQVYHYFSYTMFFWSRHFTVFLLNGLSCSKDCHGFWETESGGYLVKWQESGWWCEVEQISLWGYNGDIMEVNMYIYI
jgi:hypothetical protein